LELVVGVGIAVRLLSILVLGLGMSGLFWLSGDRGAPTPQEQDILPMKEFDVPDLPAAAAVRRVLDGWCLRHYQQHGSEYRREWEVHGETVAQDADENAYVLKPVVLFCEYPETGEGEPRMVTFHADLGRYAKGMEAFRLEGDVRARTTDGSELSATDLLSTLDKKDLHAVGQVHLKRAGLDLRGTGFVSDTQLTHVTLDRWVKVEMRAEGGPAVFRPRDEPRAGGVVKTSLDTTIVTCERAMSFVRTTKPGAPGPTRYKATFDGAVELVRDIPGTSASRISCDALEVLLVEENEKGKPARSYVDTLTARGHVRVADADGTMECGLLLVERKSDTLDVLTLSGPLQRVVVRKTGGARGLPGAAAPGPLEASCTGPIVIEKHAEKKAQSKALFRESVTVTQPGSLIQADELDLVLAPGAAETGLSSFVARGHVFLASEAKVALAEQLVWDREKQVTTLSGGAGVEVVQEDRRIRSRTLTLTQGAKGERVAAEGEVRIETPDLSAFGTRLDWDPSQDTMRITGPPPAASPGAPDVVVQQLGSTIQCRDFTLLRAERRMVAEGGVWIHFIDDPATRGKVRLAAPVLPGAPADAGGKREGDVWCDRQEFTWRPDGGMDRMLSTGSVVVASGATKAWGARFDWDAAAGEGNLEDHPWAVATSAADPTKPDESPTVFHARRIRFTSGGRLVLQGPKEVRMERDVVDEKGNRSRDVVVAVCERDLLIADGGKELFLDRDVHVTTGEASVQCDRMRVFTDEKTGRVGRILAWGHVRYRSEDGLALAKQMEWEPDTRATDLRSLPPVVMVDSDGRLFYAEHITITNHGKNLVAENEVRRRDIWLPGSGKPHEEKGPPGAGPGPHKGH